MSDDPQPQPNRNTSLDSYVVQVSLGTLWGAMAGIAIFVFWTLTHFASAEDLSKAQTRLEAENAAISADIKLISLSFSELRGRVSERLKQ